MVAEILRIAGDLEGDRSLRDTPDSIVLGKLFHNASYREHHVMDLTDARFGLTSVDLSWSDVESTETSVLYNEVQMASKAVDLLITAVVSTETFGEGRALSEEFPSHSSVPIISLHDDIYHWQSALSHLYGLKRQLGSLSGKQIVISWVYGSTFSSPSLAHALIVLGVLSGAHIRVVAPSDFSVLGRVRREAIKASATSEALEFTHDFQGAFDDAAAIIPYNWFRLDCFNHPERNPQYAQKYRDWYIKPDILPEHCIFSPEPPFQPDLMFSPELLEDSRNISSSWLSRRVRVLAATIVYVLREYRNGRSVSIV